MKIDHYLFHVTYVILKYFCHYEFLKYSKICFPIKNLKLLEILMKSLKKSVHSLWKIGDNLVLKSL